MKVEVEVHCNMCGNVDENGDIHRPEMTGSDKMVVNPESGTQSRQYQCSDCGNDVNVTLIPKRD